MAIRNARFGGKFGPLFAFFFTISLAIGRKRWGVVLCVHFAQSHWWDVAAFSLSLCVGQIVFN